MSNLLQMQETLMRDDARERGYYILSLLSLSLSLSLLYITRVYAYLSRYFYMALLNNILALSMALSEPWTTNRLFPAPPLVSSMFTRTTLLRSETDLIVAPPLPMSRPQMSFGMTTSMVCSVFGGAFVVDRSNLPLA